MHDTRSIALIYHNKRILTARPASLAEAIAKAATFFDVDPATISLQLESVGWWYDVAEDAWDTKAMSLCDPTVLKVAVSAVPLVRSDARREPEEVVIKEDQAATNQIESLADLSLEPHPSTLPPNPALPPPAIDTPRPRSAAAAQSSSSAGQPIQKPLSSSLPKDMIVRISGENEELRIKCRRSVGVRTLRRAAADRWGEHFENVRLLLEGEGLNGGTLESYLNHDFDGPGEEVHVDLFIWRG